MDYWPIALYLIFLVIYRISESIVMVRVGSWKKWPKWEWTLPLVVVVETEEPVKVQGPAVPGEFRVYNPYPNPFNPVTTIRYELPIECWVELVVYDVLGRKIKVLENRYKSAGVYETVWNGKDHNGKEVGSGVYLFRLKAGEFVKHGKMVLVR